MDGDGTLIIKLVNVTDTPVPVNFEIANFDGYQTTGILQTVSGDSALTVNSLRNPEAVSLKEEEIAVSSSFSREMPPYSVSVIRIPKDI